MQIVAEIANTHDGSFGNAVSFIVASAKAGADAVKFQYHLPDIESSEGEHWRPNVLNPMGETRLEYWKRVSFTANRMRQLADVARRNQIRFGVSVFCSEAVQEASQWSSFLKIPSGEWDNTLLIDAVQSTDLPVYQSLGMAPDDYKLRHGFTPVHCVSRYPCLPEEIEMVNGWGYSDHSGTIWPGVIAAWEAAPYYETHVCWSRQSFGPDVKSSITMEQLKELVAAVQFVKAMGTYPPPEDARIDTHTTYRKGRYPR